MTFRTVNIPGHLYFVTATICGWKRLFNEEQFAKIVLDSLKWLQDNQRMKLFAFVVMPNHLHFINQPINEFTMSIIKQNFGSFTAHAILKELRKQENRELLDYFHRRAIECNEGSKHKIWEDIQAKNIYTRDFLLQKLKYIHNNPVQANWGLTEERWQWKFSSACFYEKGIQPIIPVSDIREFLV